MRKLPGSVMEDVSGEFLVAWGWRMWHRALSLLIVVTRL